jgi:hypothetical protein
MCRICKDICWIILHIVHMYKDTHTRKRISKIHYSQRWWHFTCPLNFSFFNLHRRPPLWSSLQSSWGPGFDSRRYQIFWEIVDMERSPLSLVSITEELLEWKSSGSRSRKLRLTAVWIRCADHATLYQQNLALTLSTSGDRSVYIVRLWTKATVFSLLTFIRISWTFPEFNKIVCFQSISISQP